MPLAEQAEQVRKVKRAESGMILDPVTLPLTAVVMDAKAYMREHGIGGIPNAVLTYLTNHKNLGVHTEMFSEGIVSGNLAKKCFTFLKPKTAPSFPSTQNSHQSPNLLQNEIN